MAQEIGWFRAGRALIQARREAAQDKEERRDLEEQLGCACEPQNWEHTSDRRRGLEEEAWRLGADGWAMKRPLWDCEMNHVCGDETECIDGYCPTCAAAIFPECLDGSCPECAKDNDCAHED